MGGAGGADLCAGVTCVALDACHAVGACDPSTGVCTSPALSDGSSCDDGDACTASDTCQLGVCTPGDPATASDGVLDQSQLGMVDDSWNVFNTQRMGEAFTVGKSGVLTGIEISFSACMIPSGHFELDVYSATNALLGSAKIPALGYCSAGGALTADAVGPGFFDFSSLCIGVHAGDKLRFEMVNRDIPAGGCSGAPQLCVGGPFAGNACNSSASCTYTVIIDATQPSSYAGGQITINGVAGASDDNLIFKTFVSP
jgi:hypothetical protein